MNWGVPRGHDDVADAGADVDERARSVRLRRTLVDKGDRRRDGAHEGEGLKIDPVDREAGLLRHLHELGDHVVLRRDDEDLLSPGAFALTSCRREDLEVQDRFVQRDGNRFLRLELDRGAQFFGVDDGELHRAHDDLLVGDAHGEAARR